MKDNGELYWNDEPITEAAMQAQLRVAAQRAPQPELQIRADRDIEGKPVAFRDAARGIDDDRLKRIPVRKAHAQRTICPPRSGLTIMRRRWRSLSRRR